MQPSVATNKIPSALLQVVKECGITNLACIAVASAVDCIDAPRPVYVTNSANTHEHKHHAAKARLGFLSDRPTDDVTPHTTSAAQHSTQTHTAHINMLGSTVTRETLDWTSKLLRAAMCTYVCSNRLQLTQIFTSSSNAAHPGQCEALPAAQADNQTCHLLLCLPLISYVKSPRCLM
jgi:hypothetical protein